MWCQKIFQSCVISKLLTRVCDYLSSNRNKVYLKAIITVKNFQGKKINIIMNAEEVTDFNQITYHLLSCFLTHVKRTKKDVVIIPEEEKQTNQPVSYYMKL